MTDFEMACCVYSDMYKDTYGSRPRGRVFANIAEVDAAIEALRPHLKEELNRVEAAQKQAIESYKARIQKLMADNGVDSETAIRWELQSFGIETNDCWGEESYKFDTGIPFGYDLSEVF
jgi:hypothetical protein